MANAKISALAALTGANVEQLADVVPIVDNSASATKKILVSELSQAMNVLGTVQATTSGTEKDFTIPAWAKEITVQLSGVSTNGTSNLQIQIGDAGGIETSVYSSNAGGVNNSGALGTAAAPVTTGYILMTTNTAAGTWSGRITLNLFEAAAFTWIASGTVFSADSLYSNAGVKSLSAALTTVRLTTVNGTDAFDAGKVNVIYS